METVKKNLKYGESVKGHTKRKRELTLEQVKTLNQLIKYSGRYEINIQFWPLQIAVYINKDDVELTSFGGDFEAIERALEYLNRINKKA